MAAAGLDPESLPAHNPDDTNFSSGSARAKAWRDIWGAGQGVGSIDSILSVQHIVDKLKEEYQQAFLSLNDSFAGACE